MTTIAEQVAEQLGNDGQRWETQDGRTLEAVCRAHGATVSYARSQWDEANEQYVAVEVSRGEQIRDRTRYGFSDGSAIVATDGGWDVEGTEPFSWAGA